MKRVIIFFLEIYQKISRRYLPKMCIYNPTCSEYTKQAIQKYGIIKGTFIGIKRIFRCHPFHKGGDDPLR